MQSSVTLRASDFVNSLGVDTHLPYTDGDYANVNTVLADLNYIGVNHVRDGAITDVPYPGDYGQLSYGSAAAAGIKFTMTMQGGQDIAHTLQLISQFNQRYPGSITGIEGPNEVNNWPITYNGLTGDAAAVQFQNDLYAIEKSIAGLQGIPVLNLTSWPNLAGGADLNNIHPYPKNGDQPLQWIKSAIAEQDAVSPGHPYEITETGYQTLVSQGGVDQLTQAKFTLNLVFDAASLGIKQTYLYQLLDAYDDPTNNDTEKHYGLFDANNNPKLAATALHNLTTILSDTGSTAGSFATAPMNFSASGLGAGDSTLTLEKSSGAKDLVIWSEPDIWNQNTHSAISVGSHAVNISLDATYATVNVYDPLVSANPIATAHDTSSIQVNVSDHPVIIEVSGASGAVMQAAAIQAPSAPTTTAASLSLTVSGDQFGPELPEFQVYVDGHAVGSPQYAHTLHSSGQWETVSLSGTFDPSAAHNVQVQFLNDAWDGVHDRNLYVGSVTLNGVTETGSQAVSNTASAGQNAWDPGAAVMASAGTAAYSFGATSSASTATTSLAAPTAATTSATTTTASQTGSVTLSVSGDQFGSELPKVQVLVDGKAVGSPHDIHALHSQGQWDTFTVSGAFDPTGAHQVQVQFLNDAWDGVHDRNAYVGSVTLNGVTESGAQAVSNDASAGQSAWDPRAAVMASAGTATFAFNGATTAAASTSTASSALYVKASGDQFGSELPAFDVYVDGQKVGSTQSVQALHSQGQWQTVEVDGSFNPATAHQVEIRFVNDAWDGVHDRNLYIQSVSLGGHTFGVDHVTSNTASAGLQSWDPNAAVMASGGSVVYDVFSG